MWSFLAVSKLISSQLGAANTRRHFIESVSAHFSTWMYFSENKGRVDPGCPRSSTEILYLSSLTPRFSISLVTSAISSFSLWEQTDRKTEEWWKGRNIRHTWGFCCCHVCLHPDKHFSLKRWPRKSPKSASVIQSLSDALILPHGRSYAEQLTSAENPLWEL